MPTIPMGSNDRDYIQCKNVFPPTPPPPNSDSVFTAVVRLPAYTPQFHHS